MKTQKNNMQARESRTPSNPAQLLVELEKHPFLKSMPPAPLGQMADCAAIVDFNAGDLIFKQGDPAKKFYLILRGEVNLTHAGLKGNVHIQILTGGDALGWSWLFPPYCWHFNALATAPTRAIMFDAVRLRELCGKDTALGYELLRRVSAVVIQRLQLTRRKLMKLTDAI